MFIIKFIYNGTIERLHARLVAKGFTQTYGLDFFGDIYEEVYMEQPPRFVSQEESYMVCNLMKAIYSPSYGRISTMPL